MLDGVALEKDLVAVAALGVAADGTKVVLDFELGASESTEVAKALLKRLSKRGFSPMEGCRLLSVLDGSDALRSAVSSFYPDTVFFSVAWCTRSVIFGPTCGAKTTRA